MRAEQYLAPETLSQLAPFELRYPVITVTRRIPAARSCRISRSTMGTPPTGSIGLGRSSVAGRSRKPLPPAWTNA